MQQIQFPHRLGFKKIFTPQILSKHAAHATYNLDQFGHLSSSVHASEEPFVCIMQIQTLIHATNTISSQAWVQEDLRTTDFAPSMLFMQHDKLGIQQFCPVIGGKFLDFGATAQILKQRVGYPHAPNKN